MYSGTLTIAAFAIFLISCQVEHDLDPKPGYSGLSFEDDQSIEILATVLEEKQIDFYAYQKDGKTWIAYPKADAELVDKIVAVEFGSGASQTPPDHSGYCISDEQSARTLIDTLADNNIETVFVEDSSEFCPRCFCVYWHKSHDEMVRALDDHYRKMLEWPNTLKN